MAACYYLAFDHRREFVRSLGGLGLADDSPEMMQAVASSKLLIADACIKVFNEGTVQKEEFGALVDEEYGAAAAHILRDAGVSFAMPVELADQEIFDFGFGDAFAEHIDAFDPAYVKALVRYNVDGDERANALQMERLNRLQHWIDKTDRRLLFELIVPPTSKQIAECRRGGLDFIRTMRPSLALRGMMEIHRAGIAPHLWKIEGIDDLEHARRVGEYASNPVNARPAECIVLGSGQSMKQVIRWLATTATLPGYCGFAIGRTIWIEAVRGVVQGSLDREHAIAEIVERFLECVRSCKRAHRPSVQPPPNPVVGS